MARTILMGSCIPLGAQIEFNYQWNKWMQNLNATSDKPSLVIVKPNQMNPNASIASSSADADKRICLNAVLNSNQYGITLKAAYERSGVLNDNLRKLLVESVLQYCIEAKHDLSVKDCSLLGKQIIQAFPGEEMVSMIF